MPADEVIAKTAPELDRPIIVAVNKTDDKRARERAGEFHRLGFEPVIEVSAEHGDGVAELLDEIITHAPVVTPVPEEGDEAPGDEETSVAIVGRPNVGKSSLVNRLAREERVMVSEMPGTTRDTVDVLLQWHKRTFRLVDTAGMRRPGKVADAGQVEAVSVVLAKRAMERADVAVVVVDATEGAGDREAAIAGEAERAGCGVIIAVNKWDLVKGQGQDFVTEFDDRLRFQLKFLDYAPLLHLSALTGERTPKLLEAIDRVATARRQRVTTSELNRFLEEVTAANPPVEQATPRRADPLRGADGDGAADVRVLHERRLGAALLLRAVSRQPAARAIRLRGHADPNQSAEALTVEPASVRRVLQVRQVPQGSSCRTRPNRSNLVNLLYTSHGLGNVPIPNRPVFRAQEVCDLAQVQPYVLRSWEAEFPDLGFSKTASGPRIYRRGDVERVLRLKHLLFVDGLTLAGARKQLAQEGTVPDDVAVSDAEVAALLDHEAKQSLRDVRRGLQWILGVLNGGGTTDEDRVLVALCRSRSAMPRAARSRSTEFRPSPRKAPEGRPQEAIGASGDSRKNDRIEAVVGM